MITFFLPLLLIFGEALVVDSISLARWKPGKQPYLESAIDEKKINTFFPLGDGPRGSRPGNVQPFDKQDVVLQR